MQQLAVFCDFGLTSSATRTTLNATAAFDLRGGNEQKQHVEGAWRHLATIGDRGRTRGHSPVSELQHPFDAYPDCSIHKYFPARLRSLSWVISNTRQ
jgi:hypothetical protein